MAQGFRFREAEVKDKECEQCGKPYGHLTETQKHKCRNCGHIFAVHSANHGCMGNHPAMGAMGCGCDDFDGVDREEVVH